MVLVLHEQVEVVRVELHVGEEEDVVLHAKGEGVEEGLQILEVGH